MRRQQNVAFFPGYPLSARAMAKLTGLSANSALLCTAQLAALLVWWFFLLLMHQLGIPRFLQVCACAALLAFPTSFYLLVAYSESLFCMSLLAFACFSQAMRERSWYLLPAALAGFLMTATRLVGIPVAGAFCFAAAVEWLVGRWRGQLARPKARYLGLTLLQALLSSMGSAAFFLYCQWQWGAWDLYFQVQRVGWRVVPVFSAILRPKSWLPIWFSPWGEVDHHRMNRLSHFMTPLAVWLLTAVTAVDVVAGCRQVSARDIAALLRRLPYHFMAWTLLATSLSGVFQWDFKCMSRYLLVVGIPLLVLLADMLRQQLTAHPARRRLIQAMVSVVTVLWCCFGFGLQRGMIEQFSRGWWVA